MNFMMNNRMPPNVVGELSKHFPITNHDLKFNPNIRDNFIKDIISKLPSNSKILDVSSGTKPYQQYCSHCDYKSHEFEGNTEILDVFRHEVNKKNDHDIYSPIDDIPVSDNEFDFVLCTEVFEHIPEPVNAMKELVRICKPGGKILITAPFVSRVHQQPYHFYSGFSSFFYKYLKEKFNLKIIDFKSQGDTFLLAYQENVQIFRHVHPIINNNINFKNIYNSIKDFITRYTISMSNLYKSKINEHDNPDKMTEINDFNQSTIGYCVVFEK